MKRHITVLILSIVLVFSAAGCRVNSVSDGDYYIRGLSIVESMDDMAECDEYISLFSSSPDINGIIKEIGENDYSEPKAVYKAAFTPEEIDSIFLGAAGGDADFPDDILYETRNRIVSSFPSSINAMEGTEALAATSILTKNESFISDTTGVYSLYFYVYDGGYSACVTFIPGENSIVSATGYFIINDDLSNTASQSEFTQWLFDITSLMNIEVSDISEIIETE